MIVVDASVALLGLLTDGESRRRLAEESVATPHLIDSEVTHAMRSQVARHVVDSDDAARMLRTWGRLGIERFAVTGLLDRMWALQANVSGYDAGYVALAESLSCELVTADARLAGTAGPRCPIVVVRD